MLSGHRSAWRRRGRKSRAARIAVPLAIPMALGLTLGIILAVSGGPVRTINQSALGACGSPSASPAGSGSPAAAASASAPASASASPCPSGSASTGTAVTAAVPAAPSFANGQTAFRQLGDLATNPVDGTGAAINLNQTAAQAAASMNCTLTVPANPLSAQGLATPWQLGDGCSMANAGTEGAFVEATILSPNGPAAGVQPAGHHRGHHPGRGAGRAHASPRGSQVIIDVGFNGTNLVLAGPRRPAGQLRRRARASRSSARSRPATRSNFYRLANREIASGTLQVPARAAPPRTASRA